MKWLSDRLLLLLIPYAGLLSQDIEFSHVTIEQGLSQNSGNSLIQDRRGFIWIGTQDGLNRYDGYGLKVYQHDHRDSQSISDNFILDICEDRHGYLWVGTNGGGLNRFDPTTETFLPYTHNPQDPHSLSHNTVRRIIEDREGVLWIGTLGGGITLIDPRKSRMSRIQHDDRNAGSLNSDFVIALCEDRYGAMWVGTGAGLDRYDRTTGSFQHFRNEPGNPNSLSGAAVNYIYEDRDGILWVTTANGGLNRYDPTTGLWKNFTFDPKNPKSLSATVGTCILEDRMGSLWVGTNGGLNRLDRKTGDVLRYSHGVTNPRSINENFVQTMWEDRSGTIWVGTGGGGVSKFNLIQKKFPVYRNDPSDPSTLQHNIIWGIAQTPDGQMWLSTQGAGIARFDPVTGKAQHYSNDPLKASSVSSNNVYALRSDAQGILWVATSGGGLNRFDPKDPARGFKRYQTQVDDSTSISSNNVRALLVDDRQRIWAGTLGGGLNILDPVTQKFSRFVNRPGDPKSLSHNGILSLYRDREGRYWVGTQGGLNRFSPETGTFERFGHDPAKGNSLSNDRIRCVYQDTRGILWIGTDDGLNRWDMTHEIFQRFSTLDGLPNNFIYGILEDDKGRLWVSTNRGLSRISFAENGSLIFRNYDVDDGLQSKEFNTGAYFRAADGQVYFGGINGLNRFWPDSIRDNTNLAPVVLTAFKTLGREVKLAESISEIRQIVIPQKENVFSFEFASLDYINPAKNQYAYQLEGFDEDWIMAGNRRFASYTNLSPGTYRFRVKATNSDGLWNEDGASVLITIVPPFWRMWWFNGLALLMMAGGIYGVHRLRVRAIKIQKFRLEQDVALRTREINQQKEMLIEQNDLLQSQSSEIEAQRDSLQGMNSQLELAIINLKNTEAQLVQAEKMASLGQMVAGISHEINNPLSFIDSNLPFFEEYAGRFDAIIREYDERLSHQDLNGLREELERIKEKYEYAIIRKDAFDLVRSCKHGSRRIKQIVEDLRKFSRLDDTDIKKANINDGLEMILTLLESQFGDRIRIHKRFRDIPLVEGFPAKLNQVFLNILTNAVQAIPDTGTILVATESYDGHVVVRIKDSGIGMSEETKRKIFDPFFTTKAVGKGTGLGMSIAYGIIREHCGSIDVQSRPGEGTEFLVTIPTVFSGLNTINAFFSTN